MVMPARDAFVPDSPAERALRLANCEKCPLNARRNLNALGFHEAIQRIDAKLRQARGGTGANQYKKSADVSRDTSAPDDDKRKGRFEVAKLANTSPAMVQRSRLIADDKTGEATEALRQGASINAASGVARAQKRKEKETGKETGKALTKTTKNHDDEPWFKARGVGHRAASRIRLVIQEITEEAVQLASAEVDVSSLMGDRRVSAEWNAALKRANEVAALIRRIKQEGTPSGE
ncbi:MAG: hypothetical protein ACRDJH_27275 [Thermomicrobiales bacterium]